MTTRFLLTLPENGRWRYFSPEASAFWHIHGGLIGRVMSPATPLTLAGLLVACERYAAECPENSPYPEQNQGYLAWVLVHLLHYGLVVTVPARPATGAGLDWTAVYPG
ncbi:MAG: hypothetical protein H6659_19780 [Ardenticatenaceae bacterium]|nr:hypothetical protein [Ardenticatenaceae bacterium]